MSDKKKSFLNGAFILAAAGLICKIIGAVYKIPLRHIVGEETMGVYSAVYPIYTFLLIFSTSGIPTAISKMVAEQRSKGNFNGAHRVFRSSLKILTIIGVATSALMLIGAPAIAGVLKIDSWEPIAAISLSLFFVSVLSAFRGYYQGMQNMNPTAITQLVEQLIKLIAGFYFAISWYNKYDYIMGAAGALFGITISEAAAFLVIFILYQKDKKKIFSRLEQSKIQKSSRLVMKRLLQIAIPMTIGGAVKPLVDAIDSVMVKSILQQNFGYVSEYIDALYGYLKSDCGTLINLPTVLTVALSMALVPAISDALATPNGKKEVRRISKTGLKLSMVIGLPCSVGFFAMAREILLLLYTYETKTYGSITLTADEKIAITAGFLQILAIGVLFLSVIQTAAGILQGMGKVSIPVINLAIGMAVKIFLNLLLIPNPKIGMTGVPIGTVVCYGIAAVLDIIFVRKHARTRLDLKKMILRPLGAAAVMAGVIYGMKALFSVQLAAGGALAKIIAAAIILAAAIAYFAGLILFKVFDRNDLQLMPGGKKLEKLFIKIGVIRPME